MTQFRITSFISPRTLPPWKDKNNIEYNGVSPGTMYNMDYPPPPLLPNFGWNLSNGMASLDLE